MSLRAITVSMVLMAFVAGGTRGAHAQSAADRGDAAQSTRSIMQRPMSSSPSFPQSPSAPPARSSQERVRNLQQGIRQKETLEKYKRYHGTDSATQMFDRRSPDVTTGPLH